jgi:hypothetical protein
MVRDGLDPGTDWELSEVLKDEASGRRLGELRQSGWVTSSCWSVEGSCLGRKRELDSS